MPGSPIFRLGVCGLIGKSVEVMRNVSLFYAVVSLLIGTDIALADNMSDCQSSPKPVALAGCTAMIAMPGLPSVDVARSYFNRGIYYDAIGKPKLALADYSKSIESNPHYSAPHNNRGSIYKRQGRAELALKDFDSSIEIDPQNYYALNNRGLFFMERGKMKQAEADFDRAIALNPRFGTAYLNRGSLYMYLHRRKEAVAEYKNVLASDAAPEVMRAAKKKLRSMHAGE